jgi:FixJ family two-component response regulator
MPSQRLDSHKIYIVDDDDSVRRALSRLLRSAGMNCESFASGEALLDHLPDDACGCLIMDIRMPGLTGHDVQARLRMRGTTIPVIALSAQDFRKPVDDQALLDAIKWLLGKQEQRPR